MNGGGGAGGGGGVLMLGARADAFSFGNGNEFPPGSNFHWSPKATIIRYGTQLRLRSLDRKRALIKGCQRFQNLKSVTYG